MSEKNTPILPKDKEHKEKTICHVSDYIEQVDEYIRTRKGENCIFVYRGEPRVYDTCCRANIFRKGNMDGNCFFEKSLFDAMRQNALTGEKRYLDNAIDAQHGEFPSRLLDVSYNCLYALYFAVTPYYRREEDSLDHEDGKVFIFFPDEIFSPVAKNTNDNYDAIINRDKEWHRDKIIFQKNHKFIDHIKLNNRIVAQQGAFILFQGNDTAGLPDWMTHGIIIPKESKPAIRRELRQLFGIHTGTIYPEIVNLVEDISEKSKRLNTDEFCCYNELLYTVRMLGKELDYYFDHIVDRISDHEDGEDLRESLIYIEGVIHSYRVGLLDLIQSISPGQMESFISENQLRDVIGRYNQRIIDFTRELSQHGVGEFSGRQLQISMERTDDNEYQSDKSKENGKL